MSSDYLKQLQLTKQLEQKARELARERRDAEARLASARDAVSLARELELDVTDAEATLAAASEAFSKREHAAAVAQADSCLNKVRDLELQGLASIADSVRVALEAIGGSAELEERLEKTLAMPDRPDEALALAKAVREDVGKEAGERLKQRAKRAHEMLRYADSIGLQVDVGGDDIDAVLVRLSENGPEPSWKDLNALMDRLLASFRALFDERSSGIIELASQASRAEVDLIALTELVDEAEGSLRSCEAEHAFELLSEAEERRADVLNDAIRKRIDALWAEAGEVEDRGGDLSALRSELRLSEALGEGSLEHLRRAGDALQDARNEVLMEAMHALRPRLVLSRRLGVDISEASSLLDEARSSLNERELSGALERTARARDVLDAGLSGHFALADELGRTRGLFLTARELHLAQDEASIMVAESRKLALAGKLDEARSLLASAAERLNALMFDAGARRALSGISNLSRAIAVGADVGGERERLLAALDHLRNGRHDALSELEDVTGLLFHASSEAAAERVRGASMRISSPPVDLSDLAPGIDEAKRLLDEGELLNAVGVAREVEVKALVRQRDASIAMSQRADDLLALSSVLGCTSETVKNKMDLARRSVDPAYTAAMCADVISYATQLIGDELTALLARLSRDIAAARRNGVRVDKASKLTEDAAQKLSAGDVEGCHRTMGEARAELERSAALHMDIYNRIASLNKALASSGLPPKSSTQAMLDATKRLFEAGKYDGARVSANACLHELEALAAASLVPGYMEGARDLVALLRDLSLDLPEIHVLMRKAEDADRQDRHEEALSSLKEIERAASEAIRKGLRERIDKTFMRLAYCSRLGCEVTSARNILDRASSLLHESRYQDALRAVRFASSEGERLLALFHSVEACLERAEMFLEEAEERGAQIEEAHALLERARSEMRGGKQSLALERGRMAQELVLNAVSAQLEAILDEMEARHGLSGLAGDDLRYRRIERRTVSGALQRSPRWAYLTADRYEEALHDVAEMRARALSALDAMPAGAPGRDTKAAREAFERGAFSHCIAVLAPAMAMGPVRSSLERRRMTALDDLRDMARGTPGADVSQMLDAMATAPPERFWRLHSEVLDALAVRRLEARREQIGRLIDPLRAIVLLRPDMESSLAARYLSRPLSELRDDDLQLVEGLRKEAVEIIVAEIERVRNDDDAQDATRKAAAEAEALLEDGSLTLAAMAAREADLARGWTADEREALWKGCAELRRRVSTLEALGGRFDEAMRLLQEALITSPGHSRDAMADAWFLVLEEERLLLPAIRMEVLRTSPSADGWNRMSVALVNEGGTAVGLRVGADGGGARGVLPGALPPGKRRAEIDVRDDADVRLFYRPLFGTRDASSPALIE